jgi:hypothetical protein
MFLHYLRYLILQIRYDADFLPVRMQLERLDVVQRFVLLFDIV